jgi:hypothetical protein
MVQVLSLPCGANRSTRNGTSGRQYGLLTPTQCEYHIATRGMQASWVRIRARLQTCRSRMLFKRLSAADGQRLKALQSHPQLSARINACPDTNPMEALAIVSCSLEQLRGGTVPVIEHALQHGTNDCWIEKVCSGSEADAVVNSVAKPCADYSVACRRLYFVKMIEAPKRSFHLHIAKVAIPFEVDDARLPDRAKRKERNQSHGNRELRSRAGEAVRVSFNFLRPRKPCRHHSRSHFWWRNEFQVSRIRKESEDLLDRLREPLFGDEKHDR